MVNSTIYSKIYQYKMHSNFCKRSFIFQGIQVTEEFKGLANAVKVVQDVTVAYKDPPSKRDWVTDVLTRNLVVLCEFLEGLYLQYQINP